MKKLLIIKTGETFPALKALWGDFEDFIINQAALNEEDVIIWTAYKGEEPPSTREVSGIIITGSHDMVTDGLPWSLELIEWLQSIEKKEIPTLGICYGHQLLAQAFGGKVDYHPKGIEIGTVDIELTEAGITDPLLGVLPKQFLGHVTHLQSVITLPEQAIVLAHNDFEPHHAFAMREHIWGVQFHPEFNADITNRYIQEQSEKLSAQHFDVQMLHDYVRENDFGSILLQKFVALL